MHQHVRRRNFIEVQHVGEIEHARQVNPLFESQAVFSLVWRVESPLFLGKPQTNSVIYYPGEPDLNAKHYVWS